MLVGCQHRDVCQITDLEYVKEVRAKDKNFGITFLEVLYGTMELMSSLRKMQREKWKACGESLTYLQLGGDRENGASEETEKQKLG